MRNLHLTFVYVVLVKSKVEILQNFVAFSEYMNFKSQCKMQLILLLITAKVSKSVTEPEPMHKGLKLPKRFTNLPFDFSG